MSKGRFGLCTLQQNVCRTPAASLLFLKFGVAPHVSVVHMSALQLHSPQAALTSVFSSLDIWSLVCAQMADGNDMVQALASYPTVQAAARQIGASTAAQAAAEAACEAG